MSCWIRFAICYSVISQSFSQFYSHLLFSSFFLLLITSNLLRWSSPALLHPSHRHTFIIWWRPMMAKRCGNASSPLLRAYYRVNATVSCIMQRSLRSRKVNSLRTGAIYHGSQWYSRLNSLMGIGFGCYQHKYHRWAVANKFLSSATSEKTFVKTNRNGLFYYEHFIMKMSERVIRLLLFAELFLSRRSSITRNVGTQLSVRYFRCERIERSKEILYAVINQRRRNIY